MYVVVLELDVAHLGQHLCLLVSQVVHRLKELERLLNVLLPEIDIVHLGQYLRLLLLQVVHRVIKLQGLGLELIHLLDLPLLLLNQLHAVALALPAELAVFDRRGH